MDDTTWFWQIVDARGLADVSSDEFVALNELISKAERADEVERVLGQCQRVLAMMIAPDAIKQTTVLHAFAQATEAEAAARRLLTSVEPPPSP